MRQECCPVADGVSVHKELVRAVGEACEEDSQRSVQVGWPSETLQEVCPLIGENVDTESRILVLFIDKLWGSAQSDSTHVTL